MIGSGQYLKTTAAQASARLAAPFWLSMQAGVLCNLSGSPQIGIPPFFFADGGMHYSVFYAATSSECISRLAPIPFSRVSKLFLERLASAIALRAATTAEIPTS